MSEVYKGIEKYIFSDTYNFFLKYRNIENTEHAWELCITEANLLYHKYNNHPLLREIVTALLLQIEHMVNNKPYGGYTHKQWEELLYNSHMVG